MDRLLLERSILMGMAIDITAAASYDSAINSYLTFCKLHNIAPEPSPDTFSLCVTWQSAHIDPKSVDSYLSGVCSNLEPYYPDIRKICTSLLVSRTLKGAKRQHGRATKQKSPLLVSHLTNICADLRNSEAHNDKLFLSLVLCRFSGLHRLGEISDTDNPLWRNHAKTIRCASLVGASDYFSYPLPGKKSDAVFKGSTVIIKQFRGAPDPQSFVNAYLASRDALFCYHPQLFLLAAGSVPTRSWFLAHLKPYVVGNYTGQSLRAGGATALAESGATPDLIMGAGRWSSEAFHRYIHKNPVLMYALVGHHTVALTPGTAPT